MRGGGGKQTYCVQYKNMEASISQAQCLYKGIVEKEVEVRLQRALDSRLGLNLICQEIVRVVSN